MKTENPNTPIFGTPEEARVAPKFEMPKTSMPGEVAYQLSLIHISEPTRRS